MAVQDVFVVAIDTGRSSRQTFVSSSVRKRKTILCGAHCQTISATTVRRTSNDHSRRESVFSHVSRRSFGNCKTPDATTILHRSSGRSRMSWAIHLPLFGTSGVLWSICNCAVVGANLWVGWSTFVRFVSRLCGGVPSGSTKRAFKHRPMAGQSGYIHEK